MLLLATTSDVIRVVTSSTAPTDVTAHFVDLVSGVSTPDRQLTAITTATTTTVCAAPSGSDLRSVQTITIRNKHASTAQDVTVQLYDGATAYEIVRLSLAAGEALHYDQGNGWTVRDILGRIKHREESVVPTLSPNEFTTVIYSDVTNNNAVANTIADVTGLSFAVVAGNTYAFRFIIHYTAAATATGSRWSINGPAATFLSYRSEYSLTTTTVTTNEGLSTYNVPAASNVTSAATASNLAFIEGIITPSADGTVIARFASEVASSAIVAKVGSHVRYQQVI